MQKVILVPCDQKWHEQFQAIAADLTAIPSFNSSPIYHIGSTAIPGIEAKDVIDVQLGVADIKNLDPIQAELTELGYIYKPLLTDHLPAGLKDDASLWAKQFWTTENSGPKVNLHIRQIDHPNWRFALLFRDYLRADARMAESYAAAKRALSGVVDSSRYSTVKDPIIDIIMGAAEEWATKTNWVPLPDNG
jgi:GrpB-like predicted nucleotidyltransferase (UPF0157 family)